MAGREEERAGGKAGEERRREGGKEGGLTVVWEGEVAVFFPFYFFSFLRLVSREYK